jgi:raffinose/stachyose/melibiose transport system substrate-binding protein
MQKLGKLASITLAILMVVFMGACTSNAPAATQAPDATVAPVATPAPTVAPAATIKLKLLTISADENRQKIMTNFIQPNLAKTLPNIEVEFEAGGGGDDYYNKVKTYNASGDLPDVWYSDAVTAIPIIAAGNQLDLTAAISADGFMAKYSVPDALKFNDGKIYTLSSGCDTYFNPRIFYHKDIFAANNVTVPTTFEELLAVCTKLKTAGVTPMSMDGVAGWGPCLGLFQQMVQIEDPQVALDLLANKTDFTNPVVKNALGRIQSLVKAGAFPDGITTMDYGPANEMFTSKKSAMYFIFTWELPNLAKDTDVDFFLWPTAGGTKYDPAKVLQFWGSPLNGYAVFAKSKNVDAAVQLCEYCAMQDALYFADQKAPVTLDTGIKLEGVSPLMQKNLDAYSAATTKIASIWLNSMDAKTATEFGKCTSNLLTGEYSPDQFIADFNPVWQANTWFK